MFIQQNENIGFFKNFPYLVQKSTTKYFVWLAADDYWEPKLSLKESLEWTCNWFKNYENGSNMKEYSKNQINEFILKS